MKDYLSTADEVIADRSKAEITERVRDVCLRANAPSLRISEERSRAGQNNSDFGELAQLGIDLN